MPVLTNERTTQNKDHDKNCVKICTDTTEQNFVPFSSVAGVRHHFSAAQS